MKRQSQTQNLSFPKWQRSAVLHFVQSALSVTCWPQNRFSLQCSHSLFAEMTCSLVVFTWVCEIRKYRKSEILYSSLKYFQFFFKTSLLIDKDQNFIEQFCAMRETNHSKTRVTEFALLSGGIMSHRTYWLLSISLTEKNGRYKTSWLVANAFALHYLSDGGAI